MLSSFYIFHSIWSFLGWLLFIIGFFTAIGSYRMNIQQLQSTQKRISGEETRHGTQAITPPMFNSRHLTHLNHHHSSLAERERERERRDENGDSVYNSDEEKEQHEVDREDRLSDVSGRGIELMKSNRRGSRSTGISQRKGHSRYNSQPVELEQSLRDRALLDYDKDRLMLPTSIDSLRGTKSRTHRNRRDETSNRSRRTKSLRSPMFPAADDELPLEADDDSFIDTISENGPANDEYDEDFADVSSDIHMPLPSDHEFVENIDQYEDVLNQDVPDPMHDLEALIMPVMLPSPTLTVYFEFSRMIREAWLQGVLKQQKFMLVRLINGERNSLRINDLYATLLQKLIAYYESEPVSASDQGLTSSIDVLSVWQHELGDRKLEDSVDSSGQVVPWMCEIIKRVAAASAAVTGHIKELSLDDDDLANDCQAFCAADQVLERLRALVEQPIPKMPSVVDITPLDVRIPVDSMPSVPVMTRDDFVVVSPLDAREATLKYLTQSHSDRVALAQHLCINQQRRQPSAPGASTPSTPVSSGALTGSLHPVYAASGISARMLNVELMGDMEVVLAEIQASMEERLSETLSKWISDQTSLDDRLLQTPNHSTTSSQNRNLGDTFTPPNIRNDTVSDASLTRFPTYSHSVSTFRSQSAASATDMPTHPKVNQRNTHDVLPPLPPSNRTPSSNPRSPVHNMHLLRPRHHRSQSLSEPH